MAYLPMRPECQEVPHAAKINRQALAILSSIFFEGRHGLKNHGFDIL